MNIYTKHWFKTCKLLNINKYFQLISTVTDGNCLFDCIATCLTGINNNISIITLRKIIADTFLDENDTKANNTMIMWKIIYDNSIIEKDKEMLENYKHMKKLKNVKQYDILLQKNRKILYNIILNNDFWGEEYTINTLETYFNIKIIIVNGDINKIRCIDNVNKDYIIILFFCKKHYQIISYKNKFIFPILDIPLDIINILQ